MGTVWKRYAKVTWLKIMHSNHENSEKAQEIIISRGATEVADMALSMLYIVVTTLEEILKNYFRLSKMAFLVER